MSDETDRTAHNYKAGLADGLEAAAKIADHVAKDNYAPMVRSFNEAFEAAAMHIGREIRLLGKELKDE